MKIRNIQIENICGIKYLDLNFNDGLNLICGENGIGKTTILKAICHQFMYGEDSFIKKRSGSEKGTVDICIQNIDGSDYKHYEIDQFIPDYISHYLVPIKKESDSLLYFNSFRTINYKKIDALPPIKQNDNEYYTSQQLQNGIDEKVKIWFINRLVFSKVNDSLNEYQIENLNTAKLIFTLLDNNLYIKTAKPNYEIVLTQNTNDIYLEMLSDGYKSCIYILLSIIMEIELRFESMYAKDFDGVILIDEIDIHLHPQWQAKLVKVLKEVFPLAQIIATTHSPSILQNAKKEELIPLYKDDNGDTKIKELELGEYGLQGWTLEEILQDVMGMPSTTSELLIDTMAAYDKAMNDENQSEIIRNYEILKKMLHPNNPMLQLLEIQVAEWKD